MNQTMMSVEASPEQQAQPRALGLATGSAPSLREQAEAYRKAHVAAIYAGRMPTAPREGWALVDAYMGKVAPHLKYCRGDGWWTLEHACLYPTKEMAEAYANEHRGTKPSVVFVQQNAERTDAVRKDSDAK